jgi:hypothetical protein
MVFNPSVPGKLEATHKYYRINYIFNLFIIMTQRSKQKMFSVLMLYWRERKYMINT